MKRGSNILLLMIGLYVVAAVVLVLVSGSRGFAGKPAEQEPATKIVTEPETAPLSELIKGDASAGLSEEETPSLITNDLPEEEPAPAEEPVKDQDAGTQSGADTHYYRFVASHSSQGLRVRATPSMRGDILGKIQPGSTGFVITPGETWSEIITEDGKLRGYSFNEYLELTEIPESDYQAGLAAAMGTNAP